MEVKSSLGRRVGWLIIAVAPPSVLGATWLVWVKSHPWLAIGLTVAYEAALAIIAFAGEVATDLRRRWRERIVERLDQRLVRRFSGYGGRYRRYLLSSLRYIDLKGLATIGYYAPELDEVFVDVSLAFRAPHQVSSDPLSDLPSEVMERRSIWEFLDRPAPVVLALIGAAGSGKTTLLRHTARQVCKSRRRRRPIPILLYLRDHVTTVVNTPHTSLASVLRAGRSSAEPGTRRVVWCHNSASSVCLRDMELFPVVGIGLVVSPVIEASLR